MKKSLILLCFIFVIFSLSGCNELQNKNTDSAVEVIINIPKDDTVNGYRIENPSSDNNTPQNISGKDVGVGSADENKNNSKDYCGNKNSKVFHKSSCGSVKNMKEDNKYFANRDTLISKGYTPCGSCKP